MAARHALGAGRILLEARPRGDSGEAGANTRGHQVG